MRFYGLNKVLGGLSGRIEGGIEFEGFPEDP